MAKQIGRNDPCPCGSGLKYKKCCGAPEKLKREDFAGPEPLLPPRAADDSYLDEPEDDKYLDEFEDEESAEDEFLEDELEEYLTLLSEQ